QRAGEAGDGYFADDRSKHGDFEFEFVPDVAPEFGFDEQEEDDHHRRNGDQGNENIVSNRVTDGHDELGERRQRPPLPQAGEHFLEFGNHDHDQDAHDGHRDHHHCHRIKHGGDHFA